MPQTISRINPGFGPTVVVCRGVNCFARIQHRIKFYLKCFATANQLGLQPETFLKDWSLRIDILVMSFRLLQKTLRLTRSRPTNK
jgi:hypothetical protein